MHKNIVTFNVTDADWKQSKCSLILKDKQAIMQAHSLSPYSNEREWTTAICNNRAKTHKIEQKR
jgi:hypothetical protein